MLVLACLTLAISAARRRNIAQHRIWMLRTYPPIMAVGTQAVRTQAVGGLPIFLLYGQPAPAVIDPILAPCWPLNLGLAERVIRGCRLPRWNGSTMTAPNR